MEYLFSNSRTEEQRANMKLRRFGTLKRLNVEHRTFNIDDAALNLL